MRAGFEERRARGFGAYRRWALLRVLEAMDCEEAAFRAETKEGAQSLHSLHDSLMREGAEEVNKPGVIGAEEFYANIALRATKKNGG